MKKPRFRAETSRNAADIIWRELVGTNRQVSVLRGREFDIGYQSIFAVHNRDKPEPSDWFLIYAISQTLVQPSLSGSRFALQNTTREKFRQDVVAAARQYDNSVQKTAVSLVLKPNPSRAQMVTLQTTLARHGEVIRSAVTDVVHSWRREQGGSDRPVQLFGRDDINGVDAVAKLLAAMIAGLAPTGPYEKLDRDLDHQGWLEEPSGFGGVPFRFVRGPGDPREQTLEAITDAAFDASTPYQLINAHASGLRGGLTALAAELFAQRHRSNKQCRLPLLYIPLHGRTIEAPKDSFAALAHEIWQFYQNIHRCRRPRARRSSSRPALVRLFQMPQSIDQTVELLQAIHQLMAEYPAIIIFDGYRTGHYNPDTRDYSLPNLTAAIAGDRLFDLIERLVMIPTPGNDGPIDTDRFCSNRFIILSDLPIYSSDIIAERAQSLHPHPATRLINGVSIPVPPPQRDLLSGILASFGNQHPDQIGWIQSTVGIHKVDHAGLQAYFEAHTKTLLDITSHGAFSVMPVSESLCGVLSTMEMLGIKIPGRLVSKPNHPLEARPTS